MKLQRTSVSAEDQVSCAVPGKRSLRTIHPTSQSASQQVCDTRRGAMPIITNLTSIVQENRHLLLSSVLNLNKNISWQTPVHILCLFTFFITFYFVRDSHPSLFDSKLTIGRFKKHSYRRENDIIFKLSNYSALLLIYTFF